MSLSASAAAGGAPFGAADDRVYRAVAANESVDEVRRVIEQSQSAAAAVNQAGPNGQTPLQAARRLYHRDDLVCLLVVSGAEAGGVDRYLAVMWCVHKNDLAGLRRLIERGVSVNIVNENGWTPLMNACWYLRGTANRRELTLEILRRSSAETRRAVGVNGDTAVDSLINGCRIPLLQPWQAELAGELLAAGAPVQPDNAPRAMPIAAANAARREAELAALPPLGHDWRAQHKTFVRLSLDVGELRWAERTVAARRARLEALERELGSGTDSGSESESGSVSEADEASGSDGGGESGV